MAKFLFLMLLGGAIALVGDRIGKYFGKKKLTIFNLRPRYTSMIFTFIYGMMISLVTIGILALVSGNVREALFEVHALEVKREMLKQEVQDLTQLTTVNELIYRINQPIAMSEIHGGASSSEIGAKLDDLLEKANQAAIVLCNQAGALKHKKLLPSTSHLVIAQKVDYNQAVQYLSKSSGDFVAIVYALQNTYLGEPVPIRFGFLHNKLVFKSGQVILKTSINGKEPGSQILLDLFKMLGNLQQTALRSGMIPNPVTNDFGGNVMVATFLDKRDQIKLINAPAVVTVIAKQDLYSIGPLDVRIDVRPSE